MKLKSKMMKTLGMAIFLGCLNAAAQAGEVTLLSSAAIRPVIDVLGPEFERATGHKLVARFELTPAVKTQIEGGAAFDVAIANPPHIDDLMKQGKITAGTRADIARFGVGVAVRAGGDKPDVNSIASIKQALLNAKSVAYVGAGTSGVFFMGLLEKLGISAEMKPRLKPGGIAPSLTAVANGETDIAVMPVPLILANSGVALAGAVPAELQENIDMTAGVGSAARDPTAARAFINFLMAPAATAVIKAKGYHRVMQ
jgi:molybdate transport system substrate-binding protein